MILEFSDNLKKLLADRREIRFDKDGFAKNGKYEEAAKSRDLERKNLEDIFKELTINNKNNSFLEKDLSKILNLIEEEDQDFTNAISKLEWIDLERFRLMGSIEEFLKNNIKVEELSNIIEKTFYIIGQNTKQEIINNILRMK